MNIEEILKSALMVVCGYAFIPNAENIAIVKVATPGSAALIRPDGEVLETNMDDVELDVVHDIWLKNRKIYEEVSHA